MASTASNTNEWLEERLRYQVLRFVYDRAEHDCEAVLSGSQIGSALALGTDELFRVVDWLTIHGYVHHFGERPSVCLTHHGIQYLEARAGRRCSLRD